MNIINFLIGLSSLAAAAVATPWGQAWAARYGRRIKQERALARLNAIPEYEVGAKLVFYSADVGGGAGTLMDSKNGKVWMLAEKAVGRVLLVSVETSERAPMTCAEFEAGTAIIIPS